MTVCATTPRPVTHVGSLFGWRMGRTGLRQTFHAGWDIVGRSGDELRCPVDGVVTHVVSEDRPSSPGPFNGYGRVVTVREPLSGVTLFFAHLSRTAVAVGQRVSKGQIIGYIGNSNNGRFPGMGAHLHFEIRQNATSKASAQDPERWLAYLGWSRDRRNDIHAVAACASPSRQTQSKQIGSPPPVVDDVPPDADTDYEPPMAAFKIETAQAIAGAVGIALLVGVGLSLLVSFTREN